MSDGSAAQRVRSGGIGLLGLLWLAAAAMSSAAPPAGPARGTDPRDSLRPAFASSGDCAGCHPDAFAAWQGSHHAAAMRPADEQTVLADFSGEHTHFGVTSRFSRRDGGFFVETEGPDGAAATYEVAYTFGVAPLQQYLVELPGGRLQALSLAWDVDRRRWFHLYPDERIPPDDPLHWTGRYQRWNTMCADCHSTDLRKGYDVADDTYTTRWSEMTVGCEACHGGSAAHAAARKRGDPGVAVPAGRPDGTAIAEIEACAPCHSRRHRIVEDPAPEAPFLDGHAPALLSEGLYFPDGQIRDEVYVYGSFLQSRMYEAGVRCSDCHEPHALALRAEGNALCTRCHGDPPDPRFPLAAGRYDSATHHRHADGSDGARCVSCHMPERTYMVVDPRRDHAFKVPRPDLSLSLGTPNPCADCHDDRGTRWAADTLETWFGSALRNEPHWAKTLFAGRRGEPGSEAELADLLGDASQPAIARATAAEMLPGSGEDTKGALALAAATRDESGLVRAAAVASLDRVPDPARDAAAVPGLSDPLRAVRIQAARVLAGRRSALPAQHRPAFDTALKEYEASLAVQDDMPASHLNRAVLIASRNDPAGAAASYEHALRLDPYFLPARANLANLHNQAGRNQAAEAVLRTGIALVPDEGELHYSLGLLLAETGRLPEAADSLGRAADLLPTRARVRYNHGLALQHLGRRREAESALRAAHQVAPDDPAILYALAVFYLQDGRADDADRYAALLSRQRPGDPGVAQLRQRIRASRQGAPR